MTVPVGHPDNPAPRRAARVLLIDSTDRLLMFRGVDPADPGHQYWFTPGGGLDEGETPAQAAARELREEVGIDVDPIDLGEPVWRDVTVFPFDGYWYRQQQDFFLCRVGSVAVSTAGHDPIEQASISGYRWWSVAELDTTAEDCYPERLSTLVREILGL